MNEPHLVQRFERTPNCPRVMAKSFPCTASSRARSPRAISCVAGTSWLHRSVRHTPHWAPRSGRRLASQLIHQQGSLPRGNYDCKVEVASR
jgi:hypothetical protein